MTVSIPQSFVKLDPAEGWGLNNLPYGVFSNGSDDKTRPGVAPALAIAAARRPRAAGAVDCDYGAGVDHGPAGPRQQDELECEPEREHDEHE